MSGGDKISDALNAVSNPLSAAKSTVESARGLVKETYGLVEDVREIAAKERKHREQAEEDRAVEGSKVKVKIAQRIGRREVRDAVQEHNASMEATMAAAKAALIKQRQQEQEHALVWSMSQSERDAYYAEKKRQVEEAKAEKLRLIREADARKERNETIVASIVAFFCVIGMIWIFLLWMQYLTGNLPDVPGAGWLK